ncbi:hypothetical protein Q8A73_002977 [Channa argus]|nr:hypothetical protein Q8A73_002977 [Channa argus]
MSTSRRMQDDLESISTGSSLLYLSGLIRSKLCCRLMYNLRKRRGSTTFPDPILQDSGWMHSSTGNDPSCCDTVRDWYDSRASSAGYKQSPTVPTNSTKLIQWIRGLDETMRGVVADLEQMRGAVDPSARQPQCQNTMCILCNNATSSFHRDLFCTGHSVIQRSSSHRGQKPEMGHTETTAAPHGPTDAAAAVPSVRCCFTLTSKTTSCRSQVNYKDRVVTEQGWNSHTGTHYPRLCDRPNMHRGTSDETNTPLLLNARDDKMKFFLLGIYPPSSSCVSLYPPSSMQSLPPPSKLNIVVSAVSLLDWCNIRAISRPTQSKHPTRSVPVVKALRLIVSLLILLYLATEIGMIAAHPDRDRGNKRKNWTPLAHQIRIRRCALGIHVFFSRFTVLLLAESERLTPFAQSVFERGSADDFISVWFLCDRDLVEAKNLRVSCGGHRWEAERAFEVSGMNILTGGVCARAWPRERKRERDGGREVGIKVGGELQQSVRLCART